MFVQMISEIENPILCGSRENSFLKEKVVMCVVLLLAFIILSQLQFPEAVI